MDKRAQACYLLILFLPSSCKPVLFIVAGSRCVLHLSFCIVCRLQAQALLAELRRQKEQFLAPLREGGADVQFLEADVATLDSH